MKLVYNTANKISNARNGGGENKSGKILLFTPPYNMTVANKLRKEFFKLLKKYFPWQTNYREYLTKIQLNQIITACSTLPS